MVSVPTFDRSLKAKTAESIGNAIEYAETHCDGIVGIVHRHVGGYSAARARNFMAQAAIDGGCTHILMVDSDMVLPEHAIADLIERDVDVCLGWYVRGESDDGRTNMVRHGATDNGNCHMASELAALSPALIQVRNGGMGCAMIRTDVFGKIRRPWFVYHDHPDGSGLSEDYDFCGKCRQVGIPVHVDTRVACGHIHDRVLEAR